MGVIFQDGYSLPPGDEPLSHARIAHAGNMIEGAPSGWPGPDPAFAFDPNPARVWSNDGVWRQVTLNPIAPGAVMDYCVIGAHTLGSSGAGFTIQIDTGAGWFSPGLADLAVSDDRPIFAIFEPVAALNARFIVKDAAASVGFLAFGSALQFPTRSRYAGRAPFDLAEAPFLTGRGGSRGSFIPRRRVRSAQSLGFAWSHLREDWARAHVPGLLAGMEAGPFVIAERPQDRPQDVALCYHGGGRSKPRASGAQDLHDFAISATGYVAP